MISHKTLIGAVAAAAVLLPAASAQAAGTLSYQGDALHWTAVDAGQTVMLDGDYAGKVRFTGDDVSGALPSGCSSDEWGNSIDCAVPAGGVVMTGGAGTDSFFTGMAVPAGITVTMIGNGGKDSLKDDNREGRTVLRGGDGDDTLYGGPGDDDIDGEAGNDDVQGQAGNDVVRGGAGNDKMSGDGYADPGSDVIDGGDGLDTIEEWTQPSGSYNGIISVTMDGAANDGRAGENDNVTGIEDVVSHASGTFSGTEGPDKFTIWANITPGGSTVNGNGGDDVLTGMDYDDTFDGGAGNDRIEGGIGHDTITGGPGKDVLFGEGDGSYCGLYECKLPFGNDTINARDGEADQVDCGVGTDTAIVDALDTVANCEKVDVGGAGGPGGGGGGGGAGDGLAVAATAKRKDVLFGEGDGNYCGLYECKLPFGNDTINARDGEADQIDCGVGTDTAIVDALDTVANCEKVDVGGAGGPGGGGGGGGGAGDGLAVAATAKRKALLAKGLKLRMACAGACKVSAKLTLKGKTVGTGKRTMIGAGTAKVTVKLSKAGKRKLRKLGKASLRLTVTVKDAAGKSSKLVRTVRVKR